ncbi:MAG TPA: ABC transporter ATP-binding protein [Thermomicrobiales bacterium]|nr:ABC transporter ATP-binding protein [Thermomicrobiales bacterium]
MAYASFQPGSIPPPRGQSARLAATARETGARIDAVGVGRRFATAKGAVDACVDVDLAVDPGSFCVIVGPSGCGKSTFLRMVAGLDRPTSGTLSVTRPDGRNPTNAMVFHGRTLFPWLTLRQNVAYGLKLSGVSRGERRERADDLLDMVGLGEFRGAWPHQVSEGMRQRVSIARALAVDPDLLLMDEPFGALDEQTRFLLQEELLRIWERTGKTVLFVTHSIDEALILADKIVVMSSHPGTIRDVIDVPFARPRFLTDVRSDPVFADLFTTTWSILREEVEAGGAFSAGTA